MGDTILKLGKIYEAMRIVMRLIASVKKYLGCQRGDRARRKDGCRSREKVEELFKLTRTDIGID